jgi:hypothetical protein
VNATLVAVVQWVSRVCECHYVLVTGGAFITYCQERHEPRTLAMLYRLANEG